jgi:hypothetical protein
VCDDGIAVIVGLTEVLEIFSVLKRTKRNGRKGKNKGRREEEVERPGKER